jgi:hypothetical protein
MKPAKNKAPKASAEIVERAKALGLQASIIERSKPEHRRLHPLGSTHVDQKVVVIDGIRMSLGQARQYVAARER